MPYRRNTRARGRNLASSRRRRTNARHARSTTFRTRLPISSTGRRFARGPRTSNAMERLRSKMGELKFYSNSSTDYTLRTNYDLGLGANIHSLSDVATGTTTYERVGNVIYPKKLQLSFALRAPDLTAFTGIVGRVPRIRIIILQWYDSVPPVAATLLKMVDQTTGTPALHGQWITEARYHPASTGERAILYDRTFSSWAALHGTVQNEGFANAQANKFLRITVKPKVIAVKYDSTGSTTGRNKFYAIVYSNVPTATPGHSIYYSYSAGLWYRD